MLRVALTGGIATGKSYVARRLASLGIPTIDADVLAHQALQAGTRSAAEVRRRFGAAVVQSDGAIDRRRLGAIVFADPDARADLERIVHPEVYSAIDRWFSDQERPGAPADGRFAVADIPLLFETGREGAFDRVIVAACPQELQVERAMARDRLTREEARARLAAQWPISEKVRLADFVIRTDGTFEETDAQIERVVAMLGREAADLP
jgi:dephospho-CoA kinase